MEMNAVEKRLRENRIRYFAAGAVMTAGIAAVFLLGINLGDMKISLKEVWQVIIGKLMNNSDMLAEVKKNTAAVVWEIRIPRIICSIFAGAGLGIAGVIFQGILQNPLADPYTLGISTGASFGAALAIYINISLGIYFPVSAAALISSLITLAAVIFITKRGGGMESANLIIAGIIVSSILSSGVSLIKMLAGEDVGAIVFWLMGSLAAKSWNDAMLLMGSVIVFGTASVIFAKELDIMSLGDDTAHSLGINTEKMRTFYLIVGAALSAVCVSVCGVIGFVGLIVPHLLRFWLTSSNRVLIPLSALTGAILLSLADNAARIIASGEIPVGVITTLIGGPFFIYIFTRRRH